MTTSRGLSSTIATSDFFHLEICEKCQKPSVLSVFSSFGPTPEINFKSSALPSAFFKRSGPAVLVGVTDENGDPLVKGRKVSAFTDAEEEAVGLTDAVPFLLETKLRELGADVVTVDNFQPISIVDGHLVTGQNPASAKPVAQDVIKLLKQK